jgi:hypothetical protein
MPRSMLVKAAELLADRKQTHSKPSSGYRERGEACPKASRIYLKKGN